MDTPKYEVWAADLNTLYDDLPLPPVFAEDFCSLDAAIRAVNEYQDSTMAAWVRDKESGAIIPHVYAPLAA